MNNLFAAKLLQNFRNKKGNKGFTLIELLVVVIIIGVLAAVALPNLLGQVSKGRQAEAKTNLGALNRAQQTYRLEKASFGALANLPVKVTGQYYSFGDGGTNDADQGGQSATALTAYDNDVLDYTSGVSYDTGNVDAIICEEAGINGTAPAVDYTTLTALSCSGGEEVK
jgi:prepilin-type N-terminal cleavage/methylation domain-containing protein